MGSSNITKKALASALKELMEKEPLSKISIKDICQKCQLNRKSFYYHFEDKFALVNWIFDSEFLSVAAQSEYDSRWEFFEHLCKYFYANKAFYRRVLRVEDPNPFFDHFSKKMQPLIQLRLEEILSSDEIKPFHIMFYTDAFMCALERWLLDKEPMHYVEFIGQIRLLIEGGSRSFRETE